MARAVRYPWLTTRRALYARYEALGYKICPTCRDYVDPAVHDCESYQTIWPVTRSMDNFARAMRCWGPRRARRAK